MAIEIVPWISPSALAAFSDCRLQWKWGYVDGYRSMGRDFNLDLGTGIHHALAEYYRDEQDLVEVFDAWVREQIETTQRYMDTGGADIARALQSDLDVIEDMRKLGRIMLKHYQEYFTNEAFEVIAVEERLEREIPGTDGWMLPAIVDLLVRDHGRRGKIFVVEHKTFSRFEEWYLYKEHQFVAEAWVAEQLVDEPVSGVIYNGLRKAEKKGSTTNLFERRLIPVNEDQKKWLLRRLRGMHRQLTSGKLAIYPEPSMAKCRSCKFKEPCDLLMRGDDYQEYLDLMFVKRGDE